jgi:hypothetical protein
MHQNLIDEIIRHLVDIECRILLKLASRASKAMVGIPTKLFDRDLYRVNLFNAIDD